MSKEEKKKVKEENERILEEYGWAVVDGHRLVWCVCVCVCVHVCVPVCACLRVCLHVCGWLCSWLFYTVVNRLSLP